MTTQTLPKLPSYERGLTVYFQAVATIVPTLFIWVFANVFLVPKLQYIWELVGLTHSKAQWFMDESFFLMHHIQVIFGAVVLVIVILELRYRAWPRYRRAVITTLTVLIHTTVLIGITAIACATLFAAPLLTRKQSTSTPTPPADSVKAGVEQVVP